MTAQTASRPSGYRPTLDGWRAISILGVVIAHATHPVFQPNGLLPDPLLFRVTRLGSKGVELFFAISGFLITSRLLEEFRTAGRISLREFYVRRAFRILPPFLVFMAALTLGVWAGAWIVAPGDLGTSITFTRNYYSPWEAGSWETSHLWSLAVEEHFYLVWPALMVLLGPRRCLPWVLGLGLALTAWSVIEFRLNLVSRILPGVGFYVRSDICLNKLLFAAAAAVAVEFHPVRVRRVVRPGAVWAALAAIAAVFAAKPPAAAHFEAMLFALLVTATVLHPGTLLGSALELHPVRWMGRISFGLYLWQQLFLVPTGKAAFTGQRLPWNLIGALVCATVGYYLVERPMIRLGRRFAPPVTIGRA